MAFRPRRALAVFWKDFLDLRKNPGLLATMGVLPLVLTVVPVFVIWAYVRDPSDPGLRTMAVFYDPEFPLKGNAALFLIEKTIADWFGLFLIMPVFIPILISSQSVAGEKERRTLEPILASPITAAELVAGKSIAGVLPAVILTWIAFVVFCVAVDVAAWPIAQRPLLPNAMWSFGVLVLAPLFAFLGNAVAVLVSIRVGDSRTAQQVSGLVVMPLLALVGGQIAGWLKAGTAYYAVQGGVVLVLDLLLLALSVRLFDRERLMARWR